jgi:hypothetical protein
MATISPVTVLIKYLSQRDNQFIRPGQPVRTEASLALGMAFDRQYFAQVPAWRVGLHLKAAHLKLVSIPIKALG